METPRNIYDYITTQEIAYKKPINLNDSWSWSMYDHINLTVLYKNSQLKTGKDDFKPVKNITLPILRLQYRAEGFDVKDIQLFVNDKDDYYKSLLIRKYHEKWARENDVDTFIDTLVESYVDFGGVLVKQLNGPVPEVVPLQSIAFCDQTDILSGPIGIKHYYSADQLLDMEKNGWGKTSNGATISIKDLIALSRDQKKKDETGQTTSTPGRYIEVYEIHGNLPKSFSDPYDTSGEYETRMYICAYYTKKDSKEKGGVILYTAPEPESPFKFLARDGVYGRALGMGGAEELFEAQVWTNYDQIRMQAMLDASSKTLLKHVSATGTTLKKKVHDMENLEVLDMPAGEDVSQVDTFPRNMKLFEQSANEWAMHAHEIGSATGALLGEMPSTHTAYNTMALVTSQGQAIHDYRRGKISTFVTEIYRDWVLEYITKEIVKGQEFLSELDMDELTGVAEALVTCETNDRIKKMVLAGQTPNPDEVDLFKQLVRDEFMKGGNKHFIEIFKGEMKEAPIDVEVSIANKQEDTGKMAEALKGILSQIFATFNPQTGTFAVFDDPRMAGILNQILEVSGLDQIDTYKPPQQQLPQGNPQPGAVPSPIQPQMPQAAPQGTSPQQFQQALLK